MGNGTSAAELRGPAARRLLAEVTEARARDAAHLSEVCAELDKERASHKQTAIMLAEVSRVANVREDAIRAAQERIDALEVEASNLAEVARDLYQRAYNAENPVPEDAPRGYRCGICCTDEHATGDHALAGQGDPEEPDDGEEPGYADGDAAEEDRRAALDNLGTEPADEDAGD